MSTVECATLEEYANLRLTVTGEGRFNDMPQILALEIVAYLAGILAPVARFHRQYPSAIPGRGRLGVVARRL